MHLLDNVKETRKNMHAFDNLFKVNQKLLKLKSMIMNEHDTKTAQSEFQSTSIVAKGFLFFKTKRAKQLRSIKI